MAQMQDVKLKKAGSAPVVSITIGHAQMYTFDLVLMGSADVGATMVETTDNIPTAQRTGKHRVTLPAAAGLDEQMLSLAVNVISSKSSPGEQYSVTATISQGGVAITTARCHHSGQLEGGIQAVTCRWWLEVAK